MSFYCRISLKGRYVTIMLPRQGVLTLCEVEIFQADYAKGEENLALGKPTFQSSTGGGQSSRAVDGNSNPAWSGNSCTLTSSNNPAWWMVDLNARYSIGSIVITNRGDCCGDKLNGFEIRVGDVNTSLPQHGVTLNPVCNSGLIIPQGQTRSFYCKAPLIGRYVTIVVPRQTQLTLCEVKVFQTKLDDGLMDDSELAKCWAPKVYLYSREKWFPSSVDYFLPHMSMFHNSVRKQENLFASNLHTGASDSTSQFWYLKTKQNLQHYYSQLQFFQGQDVRSTSVPTYVLLRKHGITTDLVYWFFYPYNKGKDVCVGAIACGGCAGSHKSFGNHVGDWEHVTVRLVNNQPHQMYVGAHDFGGVYAWNGQTFLKGGEKIKISSEGHPIVFSGWGSHGNWVSPGRHVYKKLPNGDDLPDYTDYGIEWRTWENLKVIPFKKFGHYTGENTWLNFKGRWGNFERDCGIWNIYKEIADECGLNSGPTAPNWKGVMQNIALNKK